MAKFIEVDNLNGDLKAFELVCSLIQAIPGVFPSDKTTDNAESAHKKGIVLFFCLKEKGKNSSRKKSQLFSRS